MLIRFAIENHLSIREEQEISFVASSLKDPIGALFTFPNSDFELLPAAVIYGANASGKSNFVSGFQYLSEAVRYSHERGEPKGGVPRSPFLLDKKWSKAATKCEIEFVLNKVRYQYGFSCNDDEFLEEWLYTYPSGKRQTLYLRESERKKIRFGKNLRGNSRTIETLMRRNSLYLSVAAQNAHEQLTPIYSYLTNFSLKFSIQTRSIDAQAAFSDGRFDPRIIALLQRADAGIANYRFEEDVIDTENPFVTEFNNLLKKHVKDFDPNIFKGKKISLGHSTGGGKPVYLGLSSESSGTLRLLILFKDIFSALDKGAVLVIDELDASLHTYLVEDIVALFNSKTANRRGAQLIATTHDTNLLCGKLLRRDQIWFAEKDKAGASSIYPLTDIRTRNTDNIENGYLEGRFGAVPFRGRLDFLVGDDA
jgi:hypothetical protein